MSFIRVNYGVCWLHKLNRCTAFLTGRGTEPRFHTWVFCAGEATGREAAAPVMKNIDYTPEDELEFWVGFQSQDRVTPTAGAVPSAALLSPSRGIYTARPS